MINWIRIEEQLLGFELSSLEDYLTSLEEFMFEKQLLIKEKFSEFKTVKLKNEDYAQALEDSYIEDYQSFSKRYPNKLRLALLLETYTVLEKYLTKVCILLKEYFFLTKELPKRPSLSSLDAYLTTNCTVSFKEFTTEWGFIDDIRLIRNVIAHGHGSFEIENEGQSDKKKEEITKIIVFILNHSDITIMENEEDLKNMKEGIYNIHLPSIRLNIEFIKKIRLLSSKISNTVFIEKEDEC
jgi:hypothetical protein